MLGGIKPVYEGDPGGDQANLQKSKLMYIVNNEAEMCKEHQANKPVELKELNQLELREMRLGGRQAGPGPSMP